MQSDRIKQSPLLNFPHREGARGGFLFTAPPDDARRVGRGGERRLTEKAMVPREKKEKGEAENAVRCVGPRSALH